MVLDGALMRLNLEGEEFLVPFSTDFEDLTPREARRAARLPVTVSGPRGTSDPVLLTTALVFVLAQRHVEDLDSTYFAEFASALRPLFDGDDSIVELVDLSELEGEVSPRG